MAVDDILARCNGAITGHRAQATTGDRRLAVLRMLEGLMGLMGLTSGRSESCNVMMTNPQVQRGSAGGRAVEHWGLEAGV